MPAAILQGPKAFDEVYAKLRELQTHSGSIPDWSSKGEVFLRFLEVQKRIRDGGASLVLHSITSLQPDVDRWFQDLTLQWECSISLAGSGRRKFPTLLFAVQYMRTTLSDASVQELMRPTPFRVRVIGA